MKSLILLIFSLVICIQCSTSQHNPTYFNDQKNRKIIIDSVEMHLSSFGVESDSFPSIDAFINFHNKESYCHRLFYNPAIKNSNYVLDKQEIDSVLKLLTTLDLYKATRGFKVSRTDEPTSTLIIYTSEKKILVHDYGLEGDEPLPKLYSIVYKLNQSF